VMASQVGYAALPKPVYAQVEKRLSNQITGTLFQASTKKDLSLSTLLNTQQTSSKKTK
jgi:hypothetical protein